VQYTLPMQTHPNPNLIPTSSSPQDDMWLLDAGKKARKRERVFGVLSQYE
jgi:hypothetical protein